MCRNQRSAEQMEAPPSLLIKGFILLTQKEPTKTKCHKFGHKEKQKLIQFGFQQLMPQMQKQRRKYLLPLIVNIAHCRMVN